MAGTTIKFRKLRITWSVLCGVACVLLVVLWVRSYSRMDNLSFIQDQSAQYIYSYCGRIKLEFSELTYRGTDEWWAFESSSIQEMEREQAKAMGIPVDSIHIHPPKIGWDHNAIGAPYWMLISFSATLGVIPWGGARFTIRTLMIATTLIAVGLGTIVWLAQR